MIRAIFCLAIGLSLLWTVEKPADACGVKTSIRAPRIKRAVLARRATPTPRQTLVARRPIRVGPSQRERVAAGGSASASSERAVTAPASEPATPTDETTTADDTDQAAADTSTRVAATDTSATDTDTEEVAAPKPAETSRTPASFQKHIFFAPSTANLGTRAKAKLMKNASWLKRHSDRSVVIEGHCSTTGPAAPNQALSEARADSVKSFLVELGVDESRIDTKGFGLTKPEFKPGTNPKNRRVVIKVRK